MGIRLHNVRAWARSKAKNSIYMARVWKMGQSTVFPLNKLLLQLINVKPNDALIVRVHPPYVTFRKAVAEELIPVSSFTKEELPPTPAEVLGNG